MNNFRFITKVYDRAQNTIIAEWQTETLSTWATTPLVVVGGCGNPVVNWSLFDCSTRNSSKNVRKSLDKMAKMV